jgi:hypothetical protein
LKPAAYGLNAHLELQVLNGGAGNRRRPPMRWRRSAGTMTAAGSRAHGRPCRTQQRAVPTAAVLLRRLKLRR